MALYTISDLHLSSDNLKSMEVFGEKWASYMNRIKKNWESFIKETDTIIIPGDVSWAMYIEDAYDDFKYLNVLPGKKIISKGNHDYWWQTVKKMDEFLIKNGFTNISFLHNNSFISNNILICGTRGWMCPESEGYPEKDLRIFERELGRLKYSLESNKNKTYMKTIVFMHYPPFDKNLKINTEIEKILLSYNVDICVYGHLHGISKSSIIEGNINGIEYKMVSADYLDFIPFKLAE